MDRERHPKVIRSWMADKIRKLTSSRKRVAPITHKPEPHNKT